MRVMLVIALTLAVGLAQSYPPGQYPPGQYPPGQYPRDSRYPGEGGLGLPIPQIKFPRRGAKTDKAEKKKDAELKIELAGTEGKLERLGDKELFLDTAKGVVRYRLLAKTQFRDKEGDPIRDALLKAGDRLRVEVNAEDEETALRVTLLEVGKAAARPASTSAEGPEGGGEARPVLRRTPEGIKSEPRRTAEQGESLEGRVAIGDESIFFKKVDPIIAEARAAAENFSETLPNFIVRQLTTRYASNTNPAQWHALDVLAVEVAVVNGQEEYRNLTINGKPSKTGAEKSGSWSTGEFATKLQDVLSPATDATFFRRAESRIANRTAVVYDFTVRQQNSHWHIVAEKSTYRPGYKGSLWIDKETHRVLRIEQQTLSLPAEFPYDKAESVLDYDFVRLDKDMYLLPVSSENLVCQRGTNSCTRNEINFRNYRRFAAESDIKFEKN